METTEVSMGNVRFIAFDLDLDGPERFYHFLNKLLFSPQSRPAIDKIGLMAAFDDSVDPEPWPNETPAMQLANMDQLWRQEIASFAHCDPGVSAKCFPYSKFSPSSRFELRPFGVHPEVPDGVETHRATVLREYGREGLRQKWPTIYG
jgi:hypothetical protein